MEQKMRRKSKKIYYDNVAVGGGAPITVQSMTTTQTDNVKQTVAQIKRLQEAGCEIIRVAVPDHKSAIKLNQIKDRITIPLIADIHFDYRLALEAINQGVDGLRINPGNIGDFDRVKKIAGSAKQAHIPIRIGVNSGSIEKRLLKKYGHPTAEAMVESALNQIKLLEENDFYEIIVSLKATDIRKTIAAYQKMSQIVDYPFHIGITEAGTSWSGTIKSAVGIGSLLTQGLGDTIRISLTADPEEEVKVGWQILQSLGLRQKGPRIISCPTCGRTSINLIKLAQQVEKALTGVDKPITVAVMGCEVNGPGEAKEADIGIAGGNRQGLIFKNGKIVKKVAEDKLVTSLIEEINKM